MEEKKETMTMMDMTGLSEEEVKIIENLRKKKEIEDYQIKKLEEYSSEDKIKAFDKLYSFIKGIYDGLIISKYQSDDAPQYCFEELMKILAGNDPNKFWEHFNNIFNNVVDG